VTLDLKSRWKRLGRLDKSFVILAALYLILLLFAPEGGFTLFLGFVVIVLGALELLRLARIGLRRAIWRLRNRLIVTYVLIAVVPLLLIITLVGLGGYIAVGQVAIYVVRSELDRRVASLQSALEGLTQAKPGARQQLTRQTGEIYARRYPGIAFLIEDRGSRLRWPEGAAIDASPNLPANSGGVASLEGRYYAWSSAAQEGTRFIAVMPLTRRYLSEMVPGFGDVSFLRGSTRLTADSKKKGGLQITTRAAKENAVTVGQEKFELPPAGRDPPGTPLPPPVNRFDLDVAFPWLIGVTEWTHPESTQSALLLVHTRFSALFQILLSQKVDELQSGVLVIFYIVCIAFLIVGIVGLAIGVSLTRTITGAVHSLYEGTQRVMRGDFSIRIRVSGRDQLADLSSSFNTMTENLERLLAVAKEKERLQAEIEIAREVQEQLYPKTAPVMRTLHIIGMCQPARMVSGDYYDYQAVPGNKLAIAIGDVAGKGISAALLMASIQSALRMELRGSLERVAELAAPSNTPVNGFRLSTAQMVSDLNQQLYATTSAEKYATFCLALYDEESGTVTYTNAGHLPPILIRNGTATSLDVNGTVVGAFPFSKYDESKVQLESGDLLVCYTDGITEPENEYGEMFGEERLIELVSKHADREDTKIIETVMEAVRQWTHSPELTDDMTVLLARKQ
jgi:sigma-B regulation protein RsbU (phosphoserine phosphatase)